MSAWGWLLCAIAAEVVGTTSLKQADQQGAAWLLVVGAYGLSFFCLSKALGEIPLGVAYAVWSGLGLCALALIGWVAFQQKPDWAGWLGMALILAGVAVLRLFSKTPVS